jgi:hypothetical protein
VLPIKLGSVRQKAAEFTVGVDYPLFTTHSQYSAMRLPLILIS